MSGLHKRSYVQGKCKLMQRLKPCERCKLCDNGRPPSIYETYLSKQLLFFFVGALASSVRDPLVLSSPSLGRRTTAHARRPTAVQRTTGDGRSDADGWRVAAAAEILLVHPPPWSLRPTQELCSCDVRLRDAILHRLVLLKGANTFIILLS